jgi:Rieske Fe-S protein
MDRRDFIKNSCVYCIGAMAIGVAVTELASCTNIPIYKSATNKEIPVPLTSFAQSKIVIVRPDHNEFDILLVKKSDTEYLALLMKCTHRDNPLNATKDGLYCPAHGSRFDLNGDVLQEPATRPLKRYATSLDQNNVIINLNS